MKVTGTVLYQGRPAKGAMLVFVRAEGTNPESPGAQGVVGDDGTYELTTYTTGDGVIAGEYVVTVVWPDELARRNVDEDVKVVDKLKGAYGPGRSRIRRTIREGQKQVEPIELR